MTHFISSPWSKSVTALSFQKSWEKSLNALPTSHHSSVTFTLHPPLPYKQSINMLFQVMMGKSIRVFFSTPFLSLLVHFSECLQGPVVKVESIFKDCCGCDWVRRLMKLDIRNAFAQESNGCCLILFLTNFTHHKKGLKNWRWLIDHWFTRHK